MPPAGLVLRTKCGAFGRVSASHGISAEIPGKACDYRLSIIVFTATRVAVTDCK